MKNQIEFWKNVSKIRSNKMKLPSCIDGVIGHEHIAEKWKSHYHQIFNSIAHSHDNEKYQDVDSMKDMEINVSDVKEAINKLELNKACGMDNIFAEDLKFAGNRLAILLSVCFNAFISHGKLPDGFMAVIISPIIKDKGKSISDMNNYRPISLASIISKVFERTLLSKIEHLILTSDNQFGFKKKTGTDMCLYVLKEMTSSYKRANSSTFMCFLDASKAFDKVNHRKLFNKLKQRKVPMVIIRILSFWYSNQTMRIRWDGILSKPFQVTNGVRQGGIISAFLFNVYMDDLSKKLNSYNIGCFVGNSLINHLLYADDLLLISPSANGLRILLRTCENYANQYDIKFNPDKSNILISREKTIKDIPYKFYINAVQMKEKFKVKYLGHILTNDLKDDEDILRECRAIYAKANMLTRQFFMCNDNVKIRLFQSFFSTFYTAQLWWKYNVASIKTLIVAYNNSFRMLFNISRYEIDNLMLTQRSVNGCCSIIRKANL